MFANLRVGVNSWLDDNCVIWDDGKLSALDASNLYVLDPAQNYRELKSYPVASSFAMLKRQQSTSVIGVAGSDVYKTLPVDQLQLYPTYSSVLAAAVEARRADPKVEVGILIYVPQKCTPRPTYMDVFGGKVSIASRSRLVIHSLLTNPIVISV